MKVSGSESVCSIGLSEVLTSQTNGITKAAENSTSRTWITTRESLRGRGILEGVLVVAAREPRGQPGERCRDQEEDVGHRARIPHPQVLERRREEVDRVEERRAGRVAVGSVTVPVGRL